MKKIMIFFSLTLIMGYSVSSFALDASAGVVCENGEEFGVNDDINGIRVRESYIAPEQLKQMIEKTAKTNSDFEDFAVDDAV